jgi:ketosteroid isomerase-like protein
VNDLSPLERVKAYYRDLNTGDVEKVARHFQPDANHYYTRLGPHRSAREIGEITEQGVKHLDASWHLEHAIEQGDEVVIEWTMLWCDPRHGDERRIDRGTEWFIVRDGRIAEVRAYHHSDGKNPQGNLLGFDHAERGHTTLERWDEVRERDGAGADAVDRVRP